MPIVQLSGFKRKGEPTAPLFRNVETLLWLLAAVYSGGAFGEKVLTQTAFLLILLIILVSSRKWEMGILAVIIGTSLIQPALMQCPFLISAILIYTKRPEKSALVMLGSALQLIGSLNPFYIPLFLLFPIGLTLWRPIKLQSHTFNATILALVLINLFPAFTHTRSPEAHQGFAFPYRIDIAKMQGVNPPGATYSSIDNHGDIATSEIQVLEHDPKHGLATFNWSQRRLWPENQYYGSVLLRIACELDGFLYSNLGCRVDHSSIRLLGEAHQTEYNSFISKKFGKLVFSDSDPLNNGAIGYQQHLFSALFQKYSLAHFILIGCSFACLLTLIPRTKSSGIYLLAIISITVCMQMYNQSIDVRIVDDRAPWPHSKGVGGIASELDEKSGIITVGRTGRAKILAIARGMHAQLLNEKVVVMEGDASVKIGSKVYEALDLPLGEFNGILDSIPIRERGTHGPGQCIQKVEGITLIGTNSARINHKSIYDAAK
jgi:hypothetical protein